MLDSGIMVEDNSDIGELDTCYGELIDGALLADKTTAVSIFVPTEKNFGEYADFIKIRAEAEGLSIKLEAVDRGEDEWADAWKKYFKPLRIGKRLMIVPAWDEDFKPLPDDLMIRMDPGMAFGAGTHETTRLCATLLEKFMKPGAHVLDVGTGSGILTVAASKLGAAEIDACDLDPVAVRIARDNFAANGVTNARAFESDLLSEVESNKKYDFICANIVADIIVRMADKVAGFLTSDGLLAVSGIINTQTERVTAALTAGGLCAIGKFSESDWDAVLFVKKV
jgi:ribosomal protein L11 methyltransferase